MVEPDPDTWQDALTRRLRTLLRTAPLHRVEAGKARRADAFADHDLRALALRILDVTIERMGLGTGATHEELREGARPLLLAVDRDLDAPSADVIADAVIEALLNEPERRQAFEERYLAVAPDDVQPKMLRFHLLRERLTPDGHTVIVATTEGINLYAGMLEYPVEDAQTADEAVLRSQVRRGRIDDAVQTARRARLRSIEYEQKILGILETTRRDVHQVDWIRDVLGMIDDARQHISDRLGTEREILGAVESRLEGDVDAGAGGQLASLRDTLTECFGRHMRLHERLIGANAAYLQEQERQAFRPRMLAPLPDLEADVLIPALAIDATRIAEHCDFLLARFQPVRAPSVLRLAHLVTRLLAPRKREAEDPFELGIPDLAPVDEPPPPFDEHDRRRVDALLAEVRMPQRLSLLLARARTQGHPLSTLKLLVLEVLSAYDPAATRAPLHVEPFGGPLLDVAFAGDDLTVQHEEGDRA
jgi:hypothetical protein